MSQNYSSTKCVADDEQDIVFKSKQVIAELIINIFVTLPILSLILFFIFNNYFITLIIYIIFLLALLMYYYLTHPLIILSGEGILIKKRFSQTKIGWNEVVSMATIMDSTQAMRYQIKTSSQTLTLPIPNEWQDFERMIVEKVGLEVEGENMAIMLNTKSPGIKRWRKIGQDYVYTGPIDKLLSMGYVDQKTWATKTMLGVVVFILMLLTMLFLYSLSKGA